jgi:hypothetical protein
MAICSSTVVAAVPSVDSQLWSELDATHAISADLSATAVVTTRLGNDLPNPTLTAIGLQFDYRINSWIASATGYYVSIRNADTGAYATVWLPAVAITYEYRGDRLLLSDRNRVERLEGLASPPTRYRNRASANWHISGDKESTSIFIADELFYDFSTDRWTRNRAQVGFQFHLSAGANLQVFYLRQNNPFGTPGRLNVLGMTLQLGLTR